MPWSWVCWLCCSNGFRAIYLITSNTHGRCEFWLISDFASCMLVLGHSLGNDWSYRHVGRPSAFFKSKSVVRAYMFLSAKLYFTLQTRMGCNETGSGQGSLQGTGVKGVITEFIWKEVPNNATLSCFHVLFGSCWAHIQCICILEVHCMQNFICPQDKI